MKEKFQEVCIPLIRYLQNTLYLGFIVVTSEKITWNGDYRDESSRWFRSGGEGDLNKLCKPIQEFLIVNNDDMAFVHAQEAILPQKVYDFKVSWII